MSFRHWPSKVLLSFLLIALTACSSVTATPTAGFTGRPRGTRTFNPSATATVTETPTIAITAAPTLTPAPTSTITPFPTDTQPAVACNVAAYAGSVNWPDGSLVPPNYSFTKKWMLKNVGSCTWTTDYTVVFVSGARLGDVTAVNLPVEVHPNQIVTVSVPLTSPSSGGIYTSYWMLRSDQNQTFGVGLTANQPFSVQIRLFTHDTRPTVSP